MPRQIARIKITLKGVKPPIWRRVDVPLEIDLRQLHFMIQDAMPWTCSHEYQFMIGSVDYGDPQPDVDITPMLDASAMKLADMVDRDLKRFDYVYDFGDWWEHRIQVESVLDAEPGTKYPRLIGGKRRAPPEDIGGALSYQEMMAVSSDPKASKRENALDQHGLDGDPEEFNMDEIQTCLDKETAKSLHEIFRDM